MRLRKLTVALLMATTSLPALADSTTGTSVSIIGVPGPGRQVSAHVVVTGKHLVTGPGFTVTGGKVQVSVNGVLAAQVEATWPFNSNLIDSGCVQFDPYGNCIRTKYISNNTDVTIPITLPTGIASAQVTARYSGDTDSHGSDSAPANVALGKAPDLYWIKSTATGTGTTEVHILDAATGYSIFKLHTGTALHEVSTDQYAFALGDANGDGKTDVYAISRYGNGTPNVEVHILDGATNYATFLSHASVALPAVEPGLAWTFDVADFNQDGVPDLYAFRKSGGGSGRTEVHIYSGKDGFQTVLGHFVMPMPPVGTDDAWEFHTAYMDADSIPDVVAVAKQNGATTEVHVVSGSSNYGAYSLETTTALAATGTSSQWVFGVNDYERDGFNDLFAVTKSGAAGVEVHALRGPMFQEFDLHTPTPIEALPSDASQTILIDK